MNISKLSIIFLCYLFVLINNTGCSPNPTETSSPLPSSDISEKSSSLPSPEKPEVSDSPSSSKTTEKYSIEITAVPVCYKSIYRGVRKPIAGKVSGVIEDNYKVVIYSKTFKWYVQPEIGDEFTEITNNTWQNEIHLGKQYAALLVNQNSTFEPLTELDQLPKGEGIIAISQIERCVPE